MALAAAGDAARGATAYVTLEPCAHVSERGPACADGLIAAGVTRVVACGADPDPRTAGTGFDRLRAAGIVVTDGVRRAEAERLNAGFFIRQRHGRPHVTLKLAMSLDGCIALADGSSRWITGERARAHAHLERARADMIVVGRGTLSADDPALDVRLDGLEDRAPRRAVLSRSLAAIPVGTRIGDALLLRDLSDLDGDPTVLAVLVEGGAGVATALLAADAVDRLLVYRAPVVLGGRRAVGDLGLTDLGAAHGRWRRTDTLDLGPDRVEDYERTR
jgi:diaminohydroxyphosphoribosylaminopyrimidine deaminase/5-amino-6-(5-phosphoribosylamino)uracil reductase